MQRLEISVITQKEDYNMNGVTFGNYHSYNDLYLILSSKEIGSPEIKKKTVSVEGADGALDYTEYFGEVKYDNRTLNFEFSTIVPQSQFMDLYSQICNAIHGKKMKITLDADKDYYYIGRLAVSAFTNDKNIGAISVECDCEPWKYKQNDTVVTQAVSGSANITLVNGRKRAVPTITTTASMSIDLKGNKYSIGKGEYIIPALELVEGNNELTVTGTGNITFTYREGGL